MNHLPSNTPEAQDAPAKSIYHTPELVDYGTMEVTTQSQNPAEQQIGSIGFDAQN
jgi:hypothetical protein